MSYNLKEKPFEFFLLTIHKLFSHKKNMIQISCNICLCKIVYGYINQM
jgi:hypothetical protein